MTKPSDLAEKLPPDERRIHRIRPSLRFPPNPKNFTYIQDDGFFLIERQFQGWGDPVC